jgi:hypothetical protein
LSTAIPKPKAKIPARPGPRARAKKKLRSQR